MIVPHSSLNESERNFIQDKRIKWYFIISSLLHFHPIRGQEEKLIFFLDNRPPDRLKRLYLNALCFLVPFMYQSWIKTYCIHGRDILKSDWLSCLVQVVICMKRCLNLYTQKNFWEKNISFFGKVRKIMHFIHRLYWWFCWLVVNRKHVYKITNNCKLLFSVTKLSMEVPNHNSKEKDGSKERKSLIHNYSLKYIILTSG